MTYAPYETTTPTQLHNHLTDEEILVMSNLADIAFEVIISQDPGLETIYDIVLDISDPHCKETVQEYVQRHRGFANGTIEFDDDTTNTENYFRYLIGDNSYPEATLLIGTDEDVAETYEEARARLNTEPNALSLLAAVTQQ